ncbi:CCA tRNA nucleotidyltransferase [Polycladomyces subterraneus]|uniref:CCA tRNA nucleotidyltransferase n=1 Tax=Polycladomyces subterraneus TaxID=1016997 RepID=A0ABT8IKF2_9BACL|nr:CCA tRNA nucleotidyltransferase [Polycladomyces subterraneus]MDN4593259.1 CCA tRNA nucleotidyltransferase [Polycladomyces subterraneus]
MDPRKAALWVMERLESAGYQAYLVGGCVRDELLGKQPKDYDVTTDARPETVQALFPRTAATGLKHGTVTVILDGQPVEVTTFRVETGYSDHRRPDKVVFVSRLEDDLARRDFTVNAMAMDREGRLYDPFGGQKDLKERRIRTVGNAEERFAEDALRMLRAVRFSAQLGFRITDETGHAICRMRHILRHLAVERVTAELEKVWSVKSPSIAVQYLQEWDLLPHLPPFHCWEHIQKAELLPAERFDRLTTREGRWGLLLHACHVPPERAAAHLRLLRLKSADVKMIGGIYQLAFDCPNWQMISPTEGKRLLFRQGTEPVLQSLQWSRVMGHIDTETAERLEVLFERWAKEMPVRQLSDLAIDGSDLIRATGCPPGRWVGQALAYLLEQVALGRLPNDRSRLLEEGRQFGK